jgi:hypothetical protein
MTSGRLALASATAAAPSPASPTTRMSLVVASRLRIPIRTTALSSATPTVIGPAGSPSGAVLMSLSDAVGRSIGRWFLLLVRR